MSAREETKRHIESVRNRLSLVVIKLMTRSMNHDRSKLRDPEAGVFEKFTPLLADTEYGSEKYKELLAQMGPALDHHYKNNRHHPEHYAYGIEDMNIVDLAEMICDWHASAQRHNGGKASENLNINAKRFGLSDQLTQIIANTFTMLERGY